MRGEQSNCNVITMLRRATLCAQRGARALASHVAWGESILGSIIEVTHGSADHIQLALSDVSVAHTQENHRDLRCVALVRYDEAGESNSDVWHGIEV